MRLLYEVSLNSVLHAIAAILQVICAAAFLSRWLEDEEGERPLKRYTVVEVIADQRDALDVSVYTHVVDADSPEEAVKEADIYDEDLLDQYKEDEMPPSLTAGAHWSAGHDRVIIIGVAPLEIGTKSLGYESNG